MSTHRLAVVMLAALSVACEARLAPGSRCMRTSDCSAPYACVSGRCREECADHRDCTPPTRCVAGSDGVSVCTFDDERCTTDADCGEDLVCRSEGCFDRCLDGSCPAGGTCAGEVCQRPGATDAGPSLDAGLATRRPCSSDAECGGGVCARLLGGTFVCRPRCTTLGDCTLGDTAVGCALFQSIAGTEVSACSVPCDLFAPTSGCPAGQACDALELPTSSGVNAAAVDCRPIDPAMLGPGASCGDGTGAFDYSLCAAGLNCDGAAPTFSCQALCTIGGALGPACASGSTCAALPAPELRYRGARLGTCEPG